MSHAHPLRCQGTWLSYCSHSTLRTWRRSGEHRGLTAQGKTPAPGAPEIWAGQRSRGRAARADRNAHSLREFAAQCAPAPEPASVARTQWDAVH